MKYNVPKIHMDALFRLKFNRVRYVLVALFIALIVIGINGEGEGEGEGKICVTLQGRL